MIVLWLQHRPYVNHLVNPYSNTGRDNATNVNIHMLSRTRAQCIYHKNMTTYQYLPLYPLIFICYQVNKQFIILKIVKLSQKRTKTTNKFIYLTKLQFVRHLEMCASDHSQRRSNSQ